MADPKVSELANQESLAIGVMRCVRKLRRHQYERIPKVSESMNPKACQHEQNPKVSDNAII